MTFATIVRSSAFSTLALLSAFGAMACSASGQNDPETTPFDGGAGDAAHSQSDGQAAAQEDGGTKTETPPAFVSNMPGAKVSDVGSPATPNLVLLSSNLLQKPSGGQTYQQWFGELQNVGTTTVCEVKVDVSFKGGDGAEIAKFSTYASGDPYEGAGDRLTIPCIAPGKVGSFYANGFADSPAAITAVTTIAIKLQPHEYPDLSPAAHAPVVTSHTVNVFGTLHGIEGTFTGGTATISNVRTDFYPRDATGLVLAQFSAIDLDTLSPGGTFPFTTSGVETPFTQYRSFIDFIEGANSANNVVVPGHRPSLLEAQVEAIEASRRAQREEVAARQDIANAR
jgi:hypothetical protein